MQLLNLVLTFGSFNVIRADIDWAGIGGSIVDGASDLTKEAVNGIKNVDIEKHARQAGGVISDVGEQLMEVAEEVDWEKHFGKVEGLINDYNGAGITIAGMLLEKVEVNELLSFGKELGINIVDGGIKIGGVFWTEMERIDAKNWMKQNLSAEKVAAMTTEQIKAFKKLVESKDDKHDPEKSVAMGILNSQLSERTKAEATTEAPTSAASTMSYAMVLLGLSLCAL